MKTQKSPEDQLHELGFQIVQSAKHNVSIAYNLHDLFTRFDEDPLTNLDKYVQLQCDPHIAPYTQISIEQLKDDYPANDPSIQCGINKPNHEAHRLICDLERIVKNLLSENRIQQLFDSLPYTAAGKFNKNKYITLYSTGITNSANSGPFAPYQIALQLKPVTLWSQTNPDVKLNDICLLIINPRAKLSKKTDDIIDSSGNFKKIFVK